MALSNKTFCWNGIVTSDEARTVAFFTEVLGWKSQQMEMEGNTMTMLANGERPLAHLRTPEDGEPSWWNNYLRVEDVDAVIAAIEKHGGKVIVPGTDIPPGRFATVQTPTGATFSLFRERDPEDTDMDVGVGNLHWVDLHSSKIDDDLAFLNDALGLPTQEMDMPSGKYHLLAPDTATRGGAMQGMNPGAPSHWVAWVQVESVDDTLNRVGNHGGEVLAPAWDAQGVGRMSIVRDPVGVAFGVIQPPAES